MQKPTSAMRQQMRARPKDQWTIMYQSWRDLLFLHWQYDAAAIQRTLPPGLQVDTFAGKAYLGIIPFFMQNVHPILVPPLAWLSDFLELNVRTYVFDENGVPGIWFYSLD